MTNWVAKTSTDTTSDNPALDAFLFEYAADIDEVGYGVLTDSMIPGDDMHGPANAMIQYPPRSNKFHRALIPNMSNVDYGDHFMELWFKEDLMEKGEHSNLDMYKLMKEKAAALELALREFNPNLDIRVISYEPPVNTTAGQHKKMAFFIFAGGEDHALHQVAEQVNDSLFACRRTMSEESHLACTSEHLMGDDSVITDLMQQTYPRMSYTEPMTHDGTKYAARIDAPRHLQEHFGGHATLTFTKNGPVDPKFDMTNSTALVYWMKQDFWKPGDGSIDDDMPALRKRVDAFSKQLAAKYEMPIHSFLFTAPEIHNSSTPCALIITTDATHETRLHSMVLDDLEAAHQPPKRADRERGE